MPASSSRPRQAKQHERDGDRAGPGRDRTAGRAAGQQPDGSVGAIGDRSGTGDHAIEHICPPVAQRTSAPGRRTPRTAPGDSRASIGSCRVRLSCGCRCSSWSPSRRRRVRAGGARPADAPATLRQRRERDRAPTSTVAVASAGRSLVRSDRPAGHGRHRGLSQLAGGRHQRRRRQRPPVRRRAGRRHPDRPRRGDPVDKPFLDIHDRIASGGERGLLGLAFHPDYPTDPRFFVDYTDLKGNTVIASYKVDPAAIRTSPIPTARRSSSGSTSPSPTTTAARSRSGRTGCSTSRWATAARAATRRATASASTRYLAKILRIDIDGGAPSGKPYAVPAGQPVRRHDPSAKPEIWLTGLRNPWRMRFDTQTGDLWIGDVGQNAWEEVDVARAGVGGLELRLEQDGGVPLLPAARRLRPDRPDLAGHRIRSRRRAARSSAASSSATLARAGSTAATCSAMPARTACGSSIRPRDGQRTPVLVAKTRADPELDRRGRGRDGLRHEPRPGRAAAAVGGRLTVLT